MRSVDTRVGRMAPKKSVMGTLCGSRLYKSLRTPTVEMQTRLGHTCSCKQTNEHFNELSLRIMLAAYKFANRALAEWLHLFQKLQCIVGIAIDHVNANRGVHMMLQNRYCLQQFARAESQLTDSESSPTRLLATARTLGDVNFSYSDAAWQVSTIKKSSL